LLLKKPVEHVKAAEAALVLRPAIAKPVANADAHLLMASALCYLDNRPEAVGHLLESVRISPRRSIDAMRIALDLWRHESPSDSRSLVELWITLTGLESRTRERNGDYQSVLCDRLLILAAYAEQARLTGLAETTYRRIIEIDPSVHAAQNNLAVILARDSQQLVVARNHVKAALELKPSSTQYRDTLEQIDKQIRLKRQIESTN